MKTLKRVVALADERLVTERKRIFHRQPVSSASLSERLAHQRQNRVPTDIRVSPNKEIVSFAWPTRRRDLRPSTEASLSSSSSTTGTESAHLDSSSHSSQRTHHTTSSASLSNTASLSSAALKESAPSLVREEAHSSTSVALAEFLRVYTPSTDGSFCTDRVVYGKRGVRITGLTPIGNYALRISFSDGHDAGIYTYEYLFHLTGQEHKYRLMREYIRSLRAQRKVRDPPRRKPSTRFKDWSQQWKRKEKKKSRQKKIVRNEVTTQAKNIWTVVVRKVNTMKDRNYQHGKYEHRQKQARKAWQ